MAICTHARTLALSVLLLGCSRPGIAIDETESAPPPIAECTKYIAALRACFQALDGPAGEQTTAMLAAAETEMSGAELSSGAARHAMRSRCIDGIERLQRACR